MGACLQAIFGPKAETSKHDQILLSQIIDTIVLRDQTKNDGNFAYYPNFFYMENLLNEYLMSEKNERFNQNTKEMVINAYHEGLVSKLIKQKQALASYLRQLQLNISKMATQGVFSNSINKLKKADQKIRKTKEEQGLLGQVCLVKFQIQQFAFKMNISKIILQQHQNYEKTEKTGSKLPKKNKQATSKQQRFVMSKTIGYFQIDSSINSTRQSSKFEAEKQNQNLKKSKILNQSKDSNRPIQQSSDKKSNIRLHYYQFVCPVNSTIEIKAECRNQSYGTISASINLSDLTQNLVILEKINFKIGVTNIGVMGVRAECLTNYTSQHRKIVELLSLRKFQITQCLQDNRKGWQGLFSQKQSERSKNDTQLMSQYENPYAA